MEERKRIFLERYPKKNFPKYIHKSCFDTVDLRKKLFSAFDLCDQEDTILKLKKLVNKAIIVEAEIDESKFKLSKTLHKLEIKHEKNIYINYMDFTNIYEFKLESIDSHFDDLYFPNADAIELFDETCSWFAHVSAHRNLFVGRVNST